MSDRKHMKKIKSKKKESLQKQINKHKEKISNEKGRLDTTKDYWKKEINEKFEPQLKETEDYLKDNE